MRRAQPRAPGVWAVSDMSSPRPPVIATQPGEHTAGRRAAFGAGTRTRTRERSIAEHGFGNAIY